MPTLNHQPVTTNSAPQVSSCAGPNTSSAGRPLVSVGRPLPSAGRPYQPIVNPIADDAVSAEAPPPAQPAAASTGNQEIIQGQHTTHPMTTRSRNNIFKTKAPSDDFVRYPLPKALLASIQSAAIEPTCFIKELGELGYFLGVEVLRTDAAQLPMQIKNLNKIIQPSNQDISNKIMLYPAITGVKSGRRSDHMQLSQEKNQDQESY
ncbi:hypothetical protein DKX38_015638 [Salix brachista]|uniref:Uncharacterized protein n=1 Tax=Salix brachista TaxID=2182728 RepID=A0A5N5L5R8_9ROSI|nr:hypothetical protein DKX38_015638 [Salix brachista]